jgi:hypothetical protein
MLTHTNADDAVTMATPPVHHLYQIRLRGVLGDSLLGAFPTFEVAASGGETILSGEIPDQAALHGVLAQVESLGLELIGVQQVSP